MLLRTSARDLSRKWAEGSSATRICTETDDVTATRRLCCARMFGGQPNAIAYLALFAFLPVAIVTFFTARPVVATTWLMLGAIMFLPERVEIDPPVLPPIDKQTIATFWVLVGCLLRAPGKLRAARPLRGLDLLFVGVCASMFVTNALNGDEQVFGPRRIPGTSLYDSFAATIKDALAIYLPFFLGRAMYRGSGDLRLFFQILVAAAVVYTPLVLWELRMSPRCHYDAYGFMQTDFQMTLRGGGYRPMVFMNGGLALAMFYLSAAVAAIAMWRARMRVSLPFGMRPGAGPVSAYLSAILVLCKSTGAIVYAIVVLPLGAFLRKPGVRLAVGLSLLVMAFPLLRATKTFPTEAIVEAAESLSEERALSLWFRFFNEDQLLERASERRWFGWSGYGRFRVYDRFTGEDLSVTDGAWMIDLGTRGVFGFVLLYSMLVVPVFWAARRLRRVPDAVDRWLVSALALIVALNATDLLPNGLFNYLPFYFAGVLAGVLEGGRWSTSQSEARSVRHAARRAARQTRLAPAVG